MIVAAARDGPVHKTLYLSDLAPLSILAAGTSAVVAVFTEQANVHVCIVQYIRSGRELCTLITIGPSYVCSDDALLPLCLPVGDFMLEN